MGLTPTTQDYKALAKSWASTTPGKVGIGLIVFVVLALSGVVLYDLKAILEYANNVILDTTSLLIHLVILAAITSPIWEPTIRHQCWTGYKLLMRKISGIFVELDPIGILRITISKFKARLVRLDAGLARLAGSKRSLEGNIQQCTAEISKSGSSIEEYKSRIQTLKAAKTLSLDQQRQLNVLNMNLQGEFENIGMKKSAVDQWTGLLKQTSGLYYNMAEVRDLVSYNIQHLSDKANFEEARRKSILATKDSLGEAIGVMKGDPQQMEDFNRALDYLNDQANDVLGAVDNFNRWSEQALTDKSIQSGVAAREGEKVFAEIKQKLTLPDGSEASPIETVQGSDGVYTQIPNSTSGSDYSQYLK